MLAWGDVRLAKSTFAVYMRKSAAFGVTLTPFRQVLQRSFPPDFHDRFTICTLLETVVGGAKSQRRLWLAIFFVGLTPACEFPWPKVANVYNFPEAGVTCMKEKLRRTKTGMGSVSRLIATTCTPYRTHLWCPRISPPLLCTTQDFFLNVALPSHR